MRSRFWALNAWLCIAACSHAAHDAGPTGQPSAPVSQSGLPAAGTPEASRATAAGPAGQGAGSGAVQASSPAAGSPTSAPRPAQDAGGAGSAGLIAGASGEAGRSAGALAPGPIGGGGAFAAGSGGELAAGSGGTAAAGMAGPFALMAVDVDMYSATEFQFPDTSLPPTNASPAFRWSGIPVGTKSLALTFTDVSGPAYKWIVWDIPPTTTSLPAGLSKTAMPSEVPGASQLGSLGNQGYAGPCCPNNKYEFVLWALDVEKLPAAAGMRTADIHNELLPMHMLAKTAPLSFRRR